MGGCREMNERGMDYGSISKGIEGLIVHCLRTTFINYSTT